MLKAKELIELGDTDANECALLNAFASQFDSRLQSELVSEIVKRYTEISRQLEEKQAELLRSDSSRREAQQIAQLGNWEYNLATNKSFWSDTMRRLIEIDDDVEPNSETYYTRVHPEDLPLVKESVATIIKGAPHLNYRYRLLMGYGRVKWVHMRAVATLDKDGNFVGMHGTLQDITQLKRIEEKLEQYNDHLEEIVREKVAEVSLTQLTTIYALVRLAESRDDETGEHIVRTSDYCRLMAEKLLEQGLYPHIVDLEYIEAISQSSPLHDIGKVGVPDAILLKPGPLTPEEFEIMKTHVTIGYNTLADARSQSDHNAFFQVGMEITLTHHEKWNGSGYPSGLAGGDIPLSGRIMALADVYDALRSRRVYKKPFSHEKAMEIITRDSGTHFDPLLVDIFIENHEAFRAIFDNSLVESGD